MPRIPVFDFQDKDLGLFIAGPRDRTPARTLRRARGISSLSQRWIESRNGSVGDVAIAAAHSLHAFFPNSFQAEGTTLYRNGSSILTGLDGTPLFFEVSEPRSGTAARYLFVSGGGSLHKVDESGNVTNWGIAAPSSGPWADPGDQDSDATVTDPQEDQIDSMAPSGWGGRGFQPLTASSIDTPSGGSGMDVTAIPVDLDQDPPFRIRRLRKNIAHDASQFTTGDTSADADHIALNVQSNDWEHFNHLELVFYLDDVDGADVYSFRVTKDTESAVQQFIRGVADVPGVMDQQDQVPNIATTDVVEESSITTNPTLFRALADEEALLEAISPITIDPTETGWQTLRIPKRLFRRRGVGNFTWADVVRVEIYFPPARSNGPVTTFRLDNLALSGGGLPSGSGGRSDGGGGMQGTYKYKVTFRNSTTGNRSNGSPAAMVARDVNRGYASLSNIPTSGDSQVDQREIWRTVGNGNRFFKIATIDDNVTTTFDDEVADFSGIDETASKDPDDVQVMTNLELPLDNAVPDSDFDDFLIDRVTAFWIKTDSGRIWFSPVGRPESKKGFINVGDQGDPLQRLVSWNGQRWCFGQQKVYRIDGTDPYIAREISGVVGVLSASRRTVVPTPFGIVYQAPDGVRIFNGTSSTLIAFEAVGKLFRGEDAENLTAFEGTVAEFGRGEYIISDESQSLALTLETGRWRDLGYSDITALYRDPASVNDRIHTGRADQIEFIEEEGTTDDDGDAIPFAVESRAHDFPNDVLQVIEDVYYEIDANGETITPLLRTLDGNVTLSDVSPTGRTFLTEELNRIFRVPALRFSGNVSSKVTIYQAEFETRPMVLGVNFPAGEARTTIPARAYQGNLATGIEFDIDPLVRQYDALRYIPLVEWLFFIANTGGTTITPVLTADNGNELSMAGASSSTQCQLEWLINQPLRIQRLRLEGDFTGNVQPFALELFVRPLNLTLTILDNR